MNFVKGFVEFGAVHLVNTGVGAGIGAIAGCAAATGVAAAGPAAIMGAAAAFISKPADYLIDIAVPMKTAMKENNFINPTLKMGVQVVTNGAVWGGAVLLGAVSLPVAGVVGGACLANAAVDYSAKVLHYNGFVSHGSAIFGSVLLKTAIIVGATAGLIFLGVVTPPVGIAVGAVLAISVLAMGILFMQKGSWYKTAICEHRQRLIFPSVSLLPTSRPNLINIDIFLPRSS